MNNDKSEMDPKAKALTRLFILLLIGAIVGIAVSVMSLGFLYAKVGSIGSIQNVWGAFSTNFTLKTIIICMNLSMLFGLIWSYRSDFKKTRSPFLLGLILFLLVLFVQSLLSLPILDLITSIVTIGVRSGFFYVLLAYQSAIFDIIAHFFGTIALIILFYLSNE